MISRPHSLKVVWLLVLVLVLGTASIAFGQASGPADRDLSVSAAGGDNDPGAGAGNANIVRITSTFLSGPACSPAIGGAFSIDVSNPNSAVPAELATLTLKVAALSASNVYPITLTLFGTTVDISESPVTTTPLANLIGANLESTYTLTSAPSIGSSITFPTSARFVQEVNAAHDSDGRLTVLVEMTGCAVGAHTIDFASHESGVATAPQFAFEGPLSVTMSGSPIATSTPTWPLYAGLGAVALVVIAGLAVNRRRTA